MFGLSVITNCLASIFGDVAELSLYISGLPGSFILIDEAESSSFSMLSLGTLRSFCSIVFDAELDCCGCSS